MVIHQVSIWCPGSVRKLHPSERTLANTRDPWRDIREQWPALTDEEVRA
jgi:hypothetical protein